MNALEKSILIEDTSELIPRKLVSDVVSDIILQVEADRAGVWSARTALNTLIEKLALDKAVK